ncbi:hypothetical protein MDA_GLEAN10023608 [Myotis davidii]|uniref:Uncharacterized protein n=1 Tax=Myotis davidii TaxID=225400 RepID=L5LMM6_MYODS|nr:hypothetical protein MDA_GLEAN10023608 [Myotis davidii]
MEEDTDRCTCDLTCHFKGSGSGDVTLTPTDRQPANKDTHTQSTLQRIPATPLPEAAGDTRPPPGAVSSH